MKTKIRIWIVAAVVTVFMMSMLGLSVSASSENTVSLESDNVYGVWGREFSVELRATQISGTGSSFTLEYDGDLVSLYGYNVSDGVSVSEDDGNILNVTVTSLSSADETILTLTFYASSELASGEYEYLTLQDSGDNTAELGKLNICQFGDVNMDGTVNSRDVLMIKQSAVLMITLTDDQKILADGFSDETVNSRDAVAITQNIVKMPVTLGNRVDIIFKDSNGNVLTKRAVVKGGELTSVPVLPEDYGWSLSETGYAEADFSEINEDMSVMVKSILEHAIEVIFLDYDGTVIYSEFIELGSDFANIPSDPTRRNYAFIGWSTTNFENIDEDLTVIAQYVRTYEVKFVDYNGDVIKTETVRLNGSAEAPTEEPTREGYDFIGWDIVFDNIESDLTVTATYEIKRYTVTFVGVDHNIVAVVEGIKHGYPVTAPVVDEVYFNWTDNKGYSFSGWDKELSSVTSDITVTALYELEITEPIIMVESKTISEEDMAVLIDVYIFSSQQPYGISLDISFDNFLQSRESATVSVNSNLMQNDGSTTDSTLGCTSKLTPDGTYELRWVDASDTGLTTDTILTFTFNMNRLKYSDEYAINILESTYIINQNMEKVTPVIISGVVSIDQ